MSRIKTQKQLAPLPTVEQAKAFALLMARRSVDCLLKEAHDDAQWEEADYGVFDALEMVESHLATLSANPPECVHEFQVRMIQASSVIGLAAQTFSRPDSPIGRMLKGSFDRIRLLPALVEELDLEAKREAAH